ncbi:uncharacterized protein [Anabrus simplex]|uniref:uncharacterized protein n=1 Tax=Anabrus simplex TaxID=316456 RepID=UPI0035A2A038
MWLVATCPATAMHATVSSTGGSRTSGHHYHHHHHHHMAPAPPLRHSASFSCLSGSAGRDRPHRARTATLPSNTSSETTDYGFVVRRPLGVRLSAKYGHAPVTLLEEEAPPPETSRLPKKEGPSSLLRGALMKKSASLLSPQAWRPPRFRRSRSNKEDVENTVVDGNGQQQQQQQQRRWRSLGALMRIPSSVPQPHPQPPPAPSSASSRAQSFYLLDDFLRPQQSPQRYLPEFREARVVFNSRQTNGANTSSSDSLELSSPVPPPVPPPPPMLRLLRYAECGCNQWRRDRERHLISPDRHHHYDTVLLPPLLWWWCMD